MAKKKVSRTSNGVSNEQQQQMQNQKSTKLSRESSMEDHDSSEEKFQNLKSLNAILLKQTMEKRQQIESLFQAKDALETELTRSGNEKTRLRDELGGSSDENFMLKIEMDLFMSFVESRVKEMCIEIDGLVKEKSVKESELEGLLVENSSIKKHMEMALVQFSDKEKVVDQLLREKNELAERVVNQEAEFVELSKVADEQKNVAAQLRKDCNDQTKTSEKLTCEVSQLKEALALVEVERDNAKKGLDAEKQNRVALKEKVVELEKTMIGK